MLLSYFNAI
jgi:hypothetical protein